MLNYPPPRRILSVVIPYYNGQDTIVRCLDSIYEQGLGLTEFEVIVVDDCSTNPQAVAAVKRYGQHKFSDAAQSNLRLLQTPENLRQGGARNCGVRAAEGVWMVYIDQDDYFMAGALKRLSEYLQASPDLDVVAMDAATDKDGEIILSGHYTNVNKVGVFVGKEYMKTQEIPWVPWCYVYRRSFLQEVGLQFVEKVRFEDSDYVCRATVRARKIAFVPLVTVCHTETSTQQSAIGNNVAAIQDLFKLSTRVKLVGEQLLAEGDPETAVAVLHHHWFKHKYNTLRFLWRVSPNQMLDILRQNKAHTPSPYWIVNLGATHPLLLTGLLSLAKPILPLIRQIVLTLRPNR